MSDLPTEPKPLDPNDYLHLLTNNPVIVSKARKAKVHPEEYLGVAYLALVRACSTYNQTKGPFEPYLNTCISHAIIDSDRTTARYKSPIRTLTTSDPPDSPYDNPPSNSLEAKEEVHKTLTLLDKLSPRHREILTLYAIDGLSYSAIATKLNIPEGSVKSRLNTARRHLNSLLSRTLPTPSP